ncbi:MAG: hypothetical protein K6D02_09465 [Lachnospiraceae bacterium]|nr:hypothetical protein [Lachnospiraceae bacterium]
MANSDKKSMLKKKLLRFQRFYFDYMNWKLFDIYMNDPAKKDSLKILDDISVKDDSDDNYEQMIFSFLDEEEQLQVRLTELTTMKSKASENDITSLFLNIPSEFKNLFSFEVKKSTGTAAGFMADLKGFEINAICELLELSYRKKGSKDINTGKIIDVFLENPDYMNFIFSSDEIHIMSYFLHLNLWQKEDYSTLPEHIVVMQDFESCILKLMCLGLVNITYTSDEENQTAYICFTEELTKIEENLIRSSRTLAINRLKAAQKDKALTEIKGILDEIIAE